MNILVLGGAGYIGSHTVKQLAEAGHAVCVVDNLQKGHRAAVDPGVPLFVGDVRDGDFLRGVFEQQPVDAVIHFAADSLVGESMADPLKYYGNNVGGAVSLLGCMRDAGVKSIVFSSTAAAYGEPERVPILETDRTLPTNAYGETKLAVEKMLRWADVAYGIRAVCLRYFNAAGADEDGRIGEDHTPETHLIPLVLQVANGQRDAIQIFGSDYGTDDGTCVRDYVHVNDLAQAHILAAERLAAGGPGGIFNLGNSTGYSVRQVIETARQVTGHPIPATERERRAGDPAVLVASNQKAVEELGWRPERGALPYIIETAWNWHKAHPRGYGE